MKWPTGFIWGTGASSTQTEGAAPAGDWYEWERMGRAPLSGDGNGFAERYAGDFALLATLGLRHHRLSIEWARIEPIEGARDHHEIERYRQILLAARAAGLEPWVCLHHFSLPLWFTRAGGFLVEANRTGAWRRHVEFMAETFGDLVAGWQPVNETNYYALAAYRGHGWPPGRDNLAESALVGEAMQLATAEAAVRLKQTGAPVASIFGLSTMVALDDDPVTRAVTDRYDAVNWSAGLDLFRDGVLRIPQRDPVERPDLAGSFDMIGFSFYSTIGVRGGQVVAYPDGAPVSPLGYAIWADGLGLVIDRLHERLPDTPLLIAEYGVGTSDDEFRADYLRRGLEITNQAIERGVDIRGFFHWTAVDNYEWLHGYDVSFGLIDRARVVRSSARVIAEHALS